jgi:hypothetical protein
VGKLDIGLVDDGGVERSCVVDKRDGFFKIVVSAELRELCVVIGIRRIDLDEPAIGELRILRRPDIACRCRQDLQADFQLR